MATTKATNISILNGIRNGAKSSYSDRIPIANQENLAGIYENLLNISPLRNDFAEALITQVMLMRIDGAWFENPLGMLKKDPMRFGYTEEEVYQNFVTAKAFNAFANAEDVYRFYQSDVMAAYHHMSPEMQYAITITYDNMRTAFTSEYGLRDLINTKVRSLVGSANWDEYKMMKQIFESAYERGAVYPIHVDKFTTDESRRDLIKKMKKTIELMKFPNQDFNIAGADSNAFEDSIYYMITPEINAELEVDILAYVYNDDYAKMKAHKIVVDKFENDDIKVALFDIRFFNVREQFRTMSDSKNGAALTWNYFYTIKEMFSFSPFYPVIAFTTQDAIVDGVTVSPLTAKPGTTETINYTVTGSAGAIVSKAVDIEIAGQKSNFTQIIPGSNIISIGKDEADGVIEVKVTSRFDKTISGNSDITVKK